MAVDETKPLSPGVLQEDLDVLASLKTMTGYAPADSNLTVAKLQIAADDREDKEEIHQQKIDEEKDARDFKVAAQWAFHNLILGAKDAVVGQFGANSTQVQDIGRKRKSERKKPKRKPKTPKTT